MVGGFLLRDQKGVGCASMARLRPVARVMMGHRWGWAKVDVEDDNMNIGREEHASVALVSTRVSGNSRYLASSSWPELNAEYLIYNEGLSFELCFDSSSFIFYMPPKA